MELHGEIDFAHAPQIGVVASRLIYAGQTDIQIDCTCLEFLDSSGLSALIETSRMAKAVGGKVQLLNLPDHTVHILQMTSLDRLFEISRIDREAAENDGPPAHPTRDSIFTVSARPEVVSDIRRQVALLARKLPFSDQEIEDIKLAVGEAATNAIRHGSPLGDGNRLTIHCEQMDDRFIIEVSDEGPGFDPASVVCRVPDQFAEGGRGLFFMKQLMDEVTVRCGPGAMVRLVKRLGNDGERLP